MKNKQNFDLTDEFDDGQAEHFTHYDYLIQTIENGQWSALVEHLGLMSNESVVRFYKIMPNHSATAKTKVKEEILQRML